MINKKYRPWKIVIIIGAIIIAAIIMMLFVARNRIEKLFIMVCSICLFILDILIIPQYFEIQSDRIIARGANSTSMQYYRSFKKQVFMFDDIKDIYVEGKKYIWINLKNGAIINLPIGGRFHRNEIIELIYEVRAQIKGYEQQYVQTNANP